MLQITDLLGGPTVLGHDIETQMDLIVLSRDGIPKKSLLFFAKYLDLSVGEMAKLLPVNERTIQRYTPQKHFNSAVSESILHIALLVARGVEVFESKEFFLSWLLQPCIALGGRTPQSLLSSRFGIGIILDELTRIEHGIVS